MPGPDAATVDTPLGPVSYSQQGEGKPLILLHSLLTDRRAFDRVTAELPGWLIAIDLPGFGDTAAASPTIEEYARLMSAGVRAICGDHRPVTVMGNGLGAFVALGMAVEDQAPLDRLVLVGCGVAFPDDAKPAFAGMIEAVQNGGMSAVTPTALRRIFTDSYLDRHPLQAEERSRVLAATDPRAFITACRALQHLDFSDRVGDVEVPTLIIVGEDDQATPPALARTLHDSLPNSELVTMSGVAHAPQIQDPAGFADVVNNFLEESEQGQEA
jgi:3-oxoadipate enol-lactonase